MRTTVANQRILIFKDDLTSEEAEKLASKRKIDAFGTVLKVASILSRPKEDDFKLVYSEHRYQPIWFLKGESNYVYDRKTTYELPIEGDEIQKLTINKKEYPVTHGKVFFDSVDHCVQEEKFELYVDGITGEKQPALSKYLEFESKQLDKNNLKDLNPSFIMVPPKTRVSGLVNQILGSSIKAIEADKIYKEKIDISNVDLYYRPVYAFQYSWITKKKEVIVEVDALTGEITFGEQVFKKYLGKALDQNFLFDVGADAAGMFIPGGSIAVKIAKKYLESKRK
ncbi:MAG: hypothetical protein ACMG57_03370 [Candidatus Dojkabacteria bacterium]